MAQRRGSASGAGVAALSSRYGGAWPAGEGEGSRQWRAAAVLGVLRAGGSR